MPTADAQLLTAITHRTGRAVPGFIVLYLWLSVIGLDLAVTAIVVVLTNVLGRIGFGTPLRLGEE